MRREFIFPVCLAVAFCLYGRSLRYDFVYDDHWRIEFNAENASLKNVLRFFTDPATQSSRASLHHEAYRPLVNLSFALDRVLWDNNPAGYRLHNIVLHAVNAALVAGLASSLFAFSPEAALFSGLLYLTHPVQIEAVAWIAERTNILSTLFLLLALLSWVRFQKVSEVKFAAGTYVCLALSLLSREIAAPFPALALLVATYVHRGKKDRRWLRSAGLHAGAMAVVVALYAVLRTAMIHQTRIAPVWGGTTLLNFANVLRVWPRYLGVLIWPAHLRISYENLTVAETWADSGVLFGAAVFLLYGVLAVRFWKRRPALSCCMIGFLCLWLPGSNIVPLTTLFAERLLYPLMIFAAIAAGLARPERRRLLWVLPLVFSFLTVRHLPVWKNDHTLWSHATEVDPENWYAWTSLATAQAREALALNAPEEKEAKRAWLNKAEASYRRALQTHVPVWHAGRVFFELAFVNAEQGKEADSREHLRRALLLRPDLRAEADRAHLH